MKIAVVMKLIYQNIRGVKILLPEAAGRCYAGYKTKYFV